MMNQEEYRKKRHWPVFKYCPRIYLDGIMKITIKYQSGLPVSKFEPVIREYEARMLSLVHFLSQGRLLLLL
jgi:hypothetical protein